jgi:hypothetical protein
VLRHNTLLVATAAGSLAIAIAAIWMTTGGRVPWAKDNQTAGPPAVVHSSTPEAPTTGEAQDRALRSPDTVTETDWQRVAAWNEETSKLDADFEATVLKLNNMTSSTASARFFTPTEDAFWMQAGSFSSRMNDLGQGLSEDPKPTPQQGSNR